MIGLLIGYMILFVHRPFEVWPILATIRLERVYMIFVLICAMFSGRMKMSTHPISLALTGFLAAVLISWTLSPWGSSESAQKEVFEWLKYIVFFFLVVSVCQSRKDLNLLLIGFVVATGVYVTHSVVEYGLGRHQYTMGVRRLLGINLSLKHPNSFSAVTIIAMPIAIFAIKQFEHKWIRRGGIVFMLIGTLGVVLTNSRMGIIGLACIASILILQSRKKAILMALICIASVSTWSVLPENSRQRIMSIYDSDLGPQNAKASAESRGESLLIGLDLFARYPVAGSGPGTWMKASGSEIVSHNLYGQMLGEVGLIGTIAFLAFILNCVVVAYKLRTFGKKNDVLLEEDNDYFASLGSAFLWVFFLMLLFGFAGGTLFRFYWIWNAAFLVMASNTLKIEENPVDWEDDFDEFADDEDAARSMNQNIESLTDGSLETVPT